MFGDDAQPGVEARAADAVRVVDFVVHGSVVIDAHRHVLTPGHACRRGSAPTTASAAATATATLTAAIATGRTGLGRTEIAELRTSLRVPRLVERRHFDVAVGLAAALVA